MVFGFDDGEFVRSTATIFVALLVFGFVPIVGLVRYVPLFKEVLLGAFAVVAFTSISDAETGIKFTLLTGMLAAVAFNAVYVPGQFLVGAVAGGLGGVESQSAAEAAGLLAMAHGLGALTNLFGLLFISPVGYILGGALGSVLNS